MASIVPRFHRSGQSSLFGKRTEDARTKVAPATKDELRALWKRLGYMTESEFLADLIEIRVHGVEHVTTIQRDRLVAVAGIGKEKGSASER